jgi:hypothetical protein
VTVDWEGDFIDVFLILFTSVSMAFVIFFFASRVARAQERLRIATEDL